VDLAGLERALVAMPGVARARVRTEPGPLDVEIVASVVAEEGVALDGASLLASLAARVAPWERPCRLEVVPAASAGPAEKWCGKQGEG
jgi:acyl-coenzyme A synthetase/AMP-(fatty) acid ligase